MTEFAQGTVHQAGADLQAAVQSDPEVLALWQGLTPLGRNEFICWVGCIHRTDKAPSRWQQAVLIDGKARKEG